MTDNREKIVVTGRVRDFVIFMDKAIYRFARHWLLFVNLVVSVFIGLPVLAPVLMHLGSTNAANLIYVAYRFSCHQLPQRSFFVFGPDAVNVYPLGVILAQELPPNIADFVGNATLGYKIAVCQRDVAIYGAMLLFGLVYGLARRWWDVEPLSLRAYVALGMVPLGIDGVTQIFGLRESTWELRLVTGVLFGVCTCWLAYPYLEQGMNEVKEQLEAKLHLG